MSIIYQSHEKFLQKGEKVEARTKLHFLHILSAFFWIIIFAAGVGIGSTFVDHKYTDPVAGLIILVLLLGGVGDFIHYWTAEFVVTNQRIFRKTGWITANISGNQLAKVESVDMYQTLIQRIFGTFSVVVRGTGGSDSVSFGPIKNARAFYQKAQAASK